MAKANKGAAVTTEGKPAAAATTKRERQFARVYEHETGEAKISSLFNSDFKLTVDLSKIPANVLNGFALQAACDYIVNEANETLKDTEIGDETARKEKALLVLHEAYAELMEGKVDFRSGTGTGLGAARSVISAMGQAVFELGKRFVVMPTGEKLEFSDQAGAVAAMKTLYTHTEPVGEKKLTGRMIFNAIQASPQVKAKLDEIRTAKPKSKVGNVEDFLGGDAGTTTEGEQVQQAA